MARPPRLDHPGALHHVIARGNERKAIFRREIDRRVYLDLLARYRARYGFRLFAFCLMPNHVHLAIETGHTPLSTVMLALQSAYAQRFNRRYERVGHLFQGRYKAFLVQSDSYLLTLLRYIHENPVRAKLVKSAELFQWSSDRRYRGHHAPAWLDIERPLSLLGASAASASRAYAEWMRRPIAMSWDDVPVWSGAVRGDEDFATKELEEHGRLRDTGRGVTIPRIIAAIDSVLGVPAARLSGPSRDPLVLTSRGLCALIARRVGRIPFAETAAVLRRDPSTVCKLALRAERLVGRSETLRRQLSALTENLRVPPLSL
ncbi:MAG TPA: transposase [Thermoanaerobaculia bacterium]